MTTLAVTAIAALVAVIESTLLSRLSILGTRPDLVLVVVTIGAYYRGTERGQIAGFVTGLVEDALTLAPLGFNAVVRLWHTAAIGAMRGSVLPDTVVAPALLTAVAFLVRVVGTVVVGSIVGVDGIVAQVFATATLLEGALTIVSAPLLFLLARPFAGRLALGRT